MSTPTHFEVNFATARRALIEADDREDAKRRFAAYVLYDDTTHVRSDLEIAFGTDAVVTQDRGAPPAAGTRDEMRAWLARHDAESEAFEPALYEDRERRLEPYLRLLAENDPWRLEGHGSGGRVLSQVPVAAVLRTTDGRITYRFEATQFVDYLRCDVALAIDPDRPHESVGLANLLDLSATHDVGLRQIVSSYEAIARELSLTERYARPRARETSYAVVFEPEAWQRYVTRRRGDPSRFLPPAGWTRR